MVPRKFLFGFVLVLLILFTGVLVWWLPPRNSTVSEKNYQGVIFHHKKAVDVLGWMLIKDDPDGAYWTPTKGQIAEMEAQLHIYAQKQLPVLAFGLDNYKRQYFGYVRDGREQIFVVGFCEPVGVDWQKELVTSPVTSDCYFEAQYDLENEQILYLWEKYEQRK